MNNNDREDIGISYNCQGPCPMITRSNSSLAKIACSFVQPLCTMQGIAWDTEGRQYSRCIYTVVQPDAQVDEGRKDHDRGLSLSKR